MKTDKQIVEALQSGRREGQDLMVCRYAIAMEPTFNSYEDIEAEMLDIRSRGERVEAMVADLTRSF